MSGTSLEHRPSDGTDSGHQSHGEVEQAHHAAVVSYNPDAPSEEWGWHGHWGEFAPRGKAQLATFVREQVYPAALDAYRTAFAILAKDPVARAAIVPDQIVPYFTAATAVPASTRCTPPCSESFSLAPS